MLSVRAGVLFSTLLAASALACSVLAAEAGAVRLYVALGDSYTAGPLIPNPTGEPIDCGRSDRNYPTLVATEIDPSEFRDVSCGSAETEHMRKPQTDLPLGGTNPPQFDALGRKVKLVTVGIGGNDMGFGGIVETCAELGIESGGQGQPCTDHYNASGRDEVGERIDGVVARRLARVIRGIERRSRRARVVVVGYPDPLPQPPGCYPVVPIAAGDLPYLHSIALRLHRMMRRVSRRGGAEFVDLLTGSAGHDVCQPPGTKWYEGLVLTSPAYPAHPNALGMEYAAREVLAVLGRPVPNRFKILGRRGSASGRITLRLKAPYRGTFRVKARAGRTRYASGRAVAKRAGKLRVRPRTRGEGRRALRERGSLNVRLKITFDPVAGSPRTKRTRVRVGG